MGETEGRASAKEVAELRRLLKVAQYDCHFLQKRLDMIRANREQLIKLLDTPTIQERLDAGGPIIGIAGKQYG